ncbi:DNA-directed RNA polymerase subunit D [Candidatus Micrarchaeota archaeon]|nr:DNA-directed RNA polymerase subunit D [Candidatus Micrarchaeota archaeon]
MNIQLLDEKERKAWFLVSGASTSLLNALRRAVISELPAFAIEEVQFYENTSPMFNEYVAARLGLVPLTFEESSSTSQVSLSLDAEAVEEPKTVYSGDLISQDEAIKPSFLHVPIMKLGKGQRLRFEAIAVVGTGKKHAKFQSALASFSSVQEYLDEEKERKAGEVGASRHAFAGKLPGDVKKNESVFYVETFNNVAAREQLYRAVRVVEAQLDRVVELVK